MKETEEAIYHILYHPENKSDKVIRNTSEQIKLADIKVCSELKKIPETTGKKVKREKEKKDAGLSKEQKEAIRVMEKSEEQAGDLLSVQNSTKDTNFQMVIEKMQYRANKCKEISKSAKSKCYGF